MSISKAHKLLGHSSHHATIETAKHLGWGKLKDAGTKCQSCAKAKAKQKSVPQKRTITKATLPNERLYHDLTTVKAPSDVEKKVNKPVWQIIVDEATGM